MSNVRETIIESVKTGIEGIYKGAGYLVDVQETTRIEYQDLTTTSPACVIVDEGDADLYYDLDSGGTIYRIQEMALTLEGHIQTDEDAVRDLANKFISDLKKWIAAFTGSGILVSYLGGTVPEIGRDRIVFDQGLRIRYYYDRSDP